MEALRLKGWEQLRTDDEGAPARADGQPERGTTVNVLATEGR